MLRRLVLTLVLAAPPLSLAAALGGCSDDDFGQERPASDAMSASDPTASVDASADLSATPDLAAFVGDLAHINGCNGVLACVNLCQPFTSACELKCIMNSTQQTTTLFNLLVSCRDMACPPTGDGGVCDTTAVGFNQADCDTCINTADQINGMCFSQFFACQKDIP
jgi:hypothetical protein